MSVSTMLNAAGGLGLFLLAMMMMTTGLKAFAGSGLKRLLSRWTSTPFRGVLSGLLVTGVVQSSSAVTIATIGFVNAGLLNLSQALGVIYGTNIGTTITGWLVSLLGFGFKIESFALPIIALGIALRIFAPPNRIKSLGEAIAGFGLFFLGLSILKDAFDGLATGYSAHLVAGKGYRLQFILAGLVATVLTQSSSAAIALILTAAAGAIVDIEAGAAANIVTTSTAIVAVLKATPNAKRLATGHVVFNVITGIIALVLLPVLLWMIAKLADVMDLEDSPVVTLALFHTVFNLVGVIFMLPWTRRVAQVLERMFRSAAEDMGKPQFLDSTLHTTPELAVGALFEELQRLRTAVGNIIEQAISGNQKSAVDIERDAEGIHALGNAVAGFIASVQAAYIPQTTASQLARGIRIARYLTTAAKLAPQAYILSRLAKTLTDEENQAIIKHFLETAARCIKEPSSRNDQKSAQQDNPQEAFLQGYHNAKANVLAAVVEHRIRLDQASELLDTLSTTRRMIEQTLKANRLLSISRREKNGHLKAVLK